MCGKMSIQLGRWKLALACAVVFSTAIAANAQSSGDTGAGPDSGQASIPTLEEVRALPPELDVVDLYRRNPIQLAPNMFDRSWSPPPTVEEVSLQGGYIYLAIKYLFDCPLQGCCVLIWHNLTKTTFLARINILMKSIAAIGHNDIIILCHCL